MPSPTLSEQFRGGSLPGKRVRLPDRSRSVQVVYQLEVPLIQYENYRGAKTFPKGSGIRPDHKVIQTQADLIANVDTVMKFAMQLARKAANP